ncbi:MAG: hypothetical protein K0U39_07660 [Alphaproteobacteria bacterium]|nr:hypothetical protein [Alphaproteobacteria bacterium]
MKIRNFFTLRLLLNIVGGITITITMQDALNGRSVLWRTIFLEDATLGRTLVEGNPLLFFLGVIIWLIIGISMFFIPAQSQETFYMRWQKLMQKFKKR